MEGRDPLALSVVRNDPKAKANFDFACFLERDLRPALERFLLFTSGFRLRPEEVQDITQDTLLAYVRSQDRVRPQKALSWCRVVARNKFLDLISAPDNRRRAELTDTHADKRAVPPDVLRDVALHEALSNLDDDERYAFCAKADGASNNEIATTLGIDVGDSHYLVRKARAKLKADKKLSDIFERGDHR